MGSNYHTNTLFPSTSPQETNTKPNFGLPSGTTPFFPTTTFHSMTSTLSSSPSTTLPSTSSSKPTTSSTSKPITSSSSKSTLSQPRLGCYKDNETQRVLPTEIDIPDRVFSLTPEKCITGCSDSGFTHAGVESESECWCGHSIPSADLRVPDSKCNLQCRGSDQTCGAFWFIEVYRTGFGT